MALLVHLSSLSGDWFLLVQALLRVVLNFGIGCCQNLLNDQ